MKRLLIVLPAVVLMIAAGNLMAAGKKAMKDATVTGEIIDTKCYLGGMMGGKGEAHKECAVACIKGGLPVGILEAKTGKVYIVVPEGGMKGANEEMVKYAAEKVTLKGKFLEKGGTKLFEYSSVEAAK